MSNQPPRLSLGPRPPKIRKLQEKDWAIVQALADDWDTPALAGKMKLSEDNLKRKISG